jgi:L-fuconolactonase
LSSHRFDIVDAQVHLTRDLGCEQILWSLEALGINSVIIDEFWGVTPELRIQPGDLLADGRSRPLSPTAQAMALDQPDRVSYLQRIEPHDPLLEEVMALLGASDGCRAVRLTLLNAADRAGFGDGSFDRVFELAIRNDLALCVMGPDITTVADVIGRFGGLRLVLDHCGWTRSAAHWDAVLGTAALAQVSMKWSHTSRAFANVAGPGGDITTTTEREFLRALDAFGPQRLMWASDVTQEQSSWAELLAFVTHHPTLSPGDKEWVLGRAARTIFDWPASSTPPLLET